eukprot:Gb_02307 [translate_table: standard]
MQEELEAMDEMDRASTFCSEMVLLVENVPDPLLSVTRGPENPAWNRWFEGPVESHGCGCWQ